MTIVVIEMSGYEPEIIHLGNLLWQVQSFTNPNKHYVVDLLEQTCTCPHFRYRGIKCKHIKAVEHLIDQTRYWEAH